MCPVRPARTAHGTLLVPRHAHSVKLRLLGGHSPFGRMAPAAPGGRRRQAGRLGQEARGCCGLRAQGRLRHARSREGQGLAALGPDAIWSARWRTMPGPWASMTASACLKSSRTFAKASGWRPGLDMLPVFEQRWKPALVKFTAPAEDSADYAVSIALCYLRDVALLGRQGHGAVWCSDSGNKPVPAERILAVEWV